MRNLLSLFSSRVAKPSEERVEHASPDGYTLPKSADSLLKTPLRQRLLDAEPADGANACLSLCRCTESEAAATLGARCCLALASRESCLTALLQAGAIEALAEAARRPQCTSEALGEEAIGALVLLAQQPQAMEDAVLAL